MEIRTKKGKEKLLERFTSAPERSNDPSVHYTEGERTAKYWIRVIRYAIKNDLAMDETDYNNTPKDYKKLWKGLK